MVFMEREDCMGIQWKVWLLELEKNQMVAIARTKKFLTAVEWLPDGDRICLWHTSKFLSKLFLVTETGILLWQIIKI